MADLNALLVFAGVAEARGFSAAARRLGMPVSTVSRLVAALEDELGIRLIERSTRNLRLTEAGTGVLEQARRGVELSDAVDRFAAERAASVSGLLRLSAPPGIAEALLAPVATAFGAAHPGVRLQISVCDSLPDNAENRADLSFRFGTLEDSSLMALRVLRFRKRLVASPDYLARHEAPMRPGDLSRHRVLTLLDRSPNRRWKFVRAEGEGRDAVPVNPHLTTDDSAGLIAALLAGGGICDLAPVIRPDLLREGKLVEIMPAWNFEASDLFLVHLGRRHVPRPVQLFKDMAAMTIPKLFPDLTSSSGPASAAFGEEDLKTMG